MASEVRNNYEICSENWMGGGRLGDLCLDLKIISQMETKERGREKVDWIYMVQVMVQWQSFVNTVMNFRVQ
jgi:hypothetical protein